MDRIIYTFSTDQLPQIDESRMTPRERHQLMLERHREAKSTRRANHRERQKYRKIIPILA